MRKLLNVNDVADLLGVSAKRVHAMVRAGCLPAPNHSEKMLLWDSGDFRAALVEALASVRMRNVGGSVPTTTTTC